MDQANLDSDISDALSRGGVIDITTTGRRSGEPRRIEIVFHNIEGRLYISGMPGFSRGYMANLASNPAFVFHLKQAVQSDLDATARIITDLAERRELLTQVARNWKRDDLEAMMEQSPLFEVTIQGPARAEASG